MWFAASASPFRRPRGFPKTRRPEPKLRKLPWTSTSLQGTRSRSCRSLAAPATLVGFRASTATSARRSTNPGFHTRFVPPPGFSTLLTACSLRAFRSRGPVPLMRFTLQSLSPPRSRTPFDASALLPFLAWRVPALRTRKSPCPAAPGLCSPRRSVLRRAEARRSRCSHGLFCLSRAFPARRGFGFPNLSFLRFLRPPSGRSGVRRSKALPRDRVDRLLAEPTDSLEVFTRDLTSASPDDRGVPSE
jgi:hypothetical protein